MTPPADGTDDATGLPWPKSWPGVYAVVLVNFAAWVALLAALQLYFS